MLQEFLTTNRTEILSRARSRVAARTAPRPTHDELTLGIPLFFDELVTILGGLECRDSAIDRDAALHGERRQQMGFTVAQVVHDYGDLCQAITQLAMDQRASFGAGEFKTLNGCLDDAIAQAVAEYGKSRERSATGDEVERLGFLAHELRNHLHTASLCYEALKTGTVAIGGATGAVLGRSLVALQDLVNRTLAQVRLDAGIDDHERVDLTTFFEEVEAASSLLAKHHDVSLSVHHPEAGLVVEADRQLLGSAVSNLLQNAFKFTKPKSHVHVRTTSTGDRVQIEVDDECGGRLPQDHIDALFQSYRHGGSDKSGLGLGLAITQKIVASMGGTVSARNTPAVGCVFTIDLPKARDRRAPLRESTAIS